MSWANQLLKTYDYCSKHPPEGNEILLPIFHSTRDAHIEVVLDHEGNFLRAYVKDKSEGLQVVIPVTEKSAIRSGSRPVHHPLSDKLQYVAGDYVAFGGEVPQGYINNPTERFDNYLTDLQEWADSEFSHPKIKAIAIYVAKGCLVKDLIEAGCLFAINNNLVGEWTWQNLKDSHLLQAYYQVDIPTNEKEFKKKTKPPIYRTVPNSANESVICWRVEIEGTDNDTTWSDSSLSRSWVQFYGNKYEQGHKDYCFVSGEEVVIAANHPNGIRYSSDKAKLISANDDSGYTFRGRFTDDTGKQACAVGGIATQKIHNALSWLIQRQGHHRYRISDKYFVAWTATLDDLPDLYRESDDLCLFHDEGHIVGDIGKEYAKRLSAKMKGYSTNIKDSQNILIMGLDSATTGRMSIVYYRELTASTFLERIEDWHQRFSWWQNFSTDKKFIGAPSLMTIITSAYGDKVDDNLKKSAFERLFPCIIDGATFPKDVMNVIFRRVCNRAALDLLEWNKLLGVSCALIRGVNNKEKYKMSLETDRKTRDYLFGRLLAVADYVESTVLSDAEKKRPTNASRLMQRFSTHPCDTWKILYQNLIPYLDRLKANKTGQWVILSGLINDIMDSFGTDDFVSNKPLSGEFLLGYHCQNKAFYTKKNQEDNDKQ